MIGAVSFHSPVEDAKFKLSTDMSTPKKTEDMPPTRAFAATFNACYLFLLEMGLFSKRSYSSRSVQVRRP